MNHEGAEQVKLLAEWLATPETEQSTAEGILLGNSISIDAAAEFRIPSRSY